MSISIFLYSLFIIICFCFYFVTDKIILILFYCLTGLRNLVAIVIRYFYFALFLIGNVILFLNQRYFIDIDITNQSVCLCLSVIGMCVKCLKECTNRLHVVFFSLLNCEHRRIGTLQHSNMFPVNN